MAINETISTGNKYRRLKDAPTKLWQRLSFWTKASDVEFDNGATAEASLGNIQGITDSVNSNASNIAASAAAVNTLNSNIGIYVGGDGKLHFKNGSGADTALNFKSYSEGYADGIQNSTPDKIFNKLVKVANGNSYSAATIGKFYLILRGDNPGSTSGNTYGGNVIWSAGGITGDGGNRGLYYLYLLQATDTRIGRNEGGSVAGHGGGGIWEFR